MLKIIPLLSLLALCSCASGPYKAVDLDRDILLKDTDNGETRERLTAVEVGHDIDTLIYAVENGYVGRKHLDKAVLSKAVARLRTIAADEGVTYSSSTLRDAIDDVLLEIPDNHLEARLWKGEGASKRLAAERKPQVGASVLVDEQKVWQVSHKVVTKKKVPVIAIRRFPSAEDEAWKGFQEAAKTALGNAPALILDVRGNGGGSANMASWLASQLFGYMHPTAVAGYYKSLTPATMALYANNPKYKMLRLLERKKPVPGYLLTQHQERIARYREASAGKLPEETYEPEEQPAGSAARPAFDKPVFVLIDAGCMSACEDMLEAVEQHPKMVSVGENTAGSVHFGNMGFLILPHSRVLVQMATIFTRYSDDRYVEKSGYAPKIRVQPGTDAMEVALTELKRTLR